MDCPFILRFADGCCCYHCQGDEAAAAAAAAAVAAELDVAAAAVAVDSDVTVAVADVELGCGAAEVGVPPGGTASLDCGGKIDGLLRVEMKQDSSSVHHSATSDLWPTSGAEPLLSVPHSVLHQLKRVFKVHIFNC